eukprot:4743695-Pleurochrysis_carterae.AAC.1
MDAAAKGVSSKLATCWRQSGPSSCADAAQSSGPSFATAEMRSRTAADASTPEEAATQHGTQASHVA